MSGPYLPYAAPSNAGAVRHDMFLDAHAIRHTGLLFFCGATIGRRNLELSHGECQAIVPCECVERRITRSTNRGRIPRPPGRLLWMASLLKLIRDFRSRPASPIAA